jgi:hypothetical protein
LFQPHEVSVIVRLTIHRTIIILGRVYPLAILVSHHALLAFLCLIIFLAIFLSLVRAGIRVIICLKAKLNTESLFVLGGWE